jgi:hypothetical protein
MTKRSLAPFAFALLACLSAQAAPKKKTAPAPAKETAAQEAPAQEIDVDAMARAKDGKPTEPLAAPIAAPAATDAPVAAETPATTPAPAPPEAAASEVAPASNDTTTAAPAQAPADAAATTAEPAADATPKTAAAPSPDTRITERPSPLAPQPVPDAIEKSIAAGCEARAAALLDAAQKADYATATRDFDAKMRTALPAPKFQQAWESLLQFGRLQARGQAHPMKGDGYIAITIPLIFDKANLYAQIACGSDGRIAGFYVKPL